MSDFHLPSTAMYKNTLQARSLKGLDWLNFFVADVQTGVGPFLAIFLAGNQWDEQLVGFTLSVGSIAGILAQTPAGAIVDKTQSKRTLIACGGLVLALSSLLIAFWPSLWIVIAAEVLIGTASSFFNPAICAISLGIVGARLFDMRQGRNQMFNSAGNVVSALCIGAIGYFFSNDSIFLFVAASVLPVWCALYFINPKTIDDAVARGQNEALPTNLCCVLGNRILLIFLVCAVGFHFANAAMLPLLGEMLSQGQGKSSMLFMSACVITTQLVIACIASWCGRKAGSWGRKPLLLIAFGVLPVRGVLYTLTHSTPLLIAIQLLDGIGAGIFNVVSVLVIADMTKGSGRFNITLGAISTAVGIGAALSQVVAGSIVKYYGYETGFLFLSAVALAAGSLFYFCTPETRQKPSEEKA